MDILRTRRDIVSWDQAFDVPLIPDLYCYHYSTPYLWVMVTSLILNIIGFTIIIRVPMLRGIAYHCICTLCNNIVHHIMCFALRQRDLNNVDERIQDAPTSSGDVTSAIVMGNRNVEPPNDSTLRSLSILIDIPEESDGVSSLSNEIPSHTTIVMEEQCDNTVNYVVGNR